MRIICLGDSVTRGISYAQGKLRILKDNYPALLKKQFALQPQMDVEVLNKGVFNDNSTLVLERLQKDVLSQQPDYVVIGVGGNDCNFQWQEVAERPDEEHEPIVLLDQFVDNIREIVQRVQEVGAKPLLLSMIPLDPARYYKSLVAIYGNKIAHWIGQCGGIEHWHAGYNQALQQLIETLDVAQIDVRTAFQKVKDLTRLISDDGIHPTAEGYQIMYQSISRYFAAEFV